MLDCVDVLGNASIENGAINQKCFDFGSVDTVHANVAACIDKLAKMFAIVFDSHEANEMCPRRHGGDVGGYVAGIKHRRPAFALLKGERVEESSKLEGHSLINEPH